jgi:hypothetical protein
VSESLDSATDEADVEAPAEDAQAGSGDTEPEFETWTNVTKPTQFPYVPPGDRAIAGLGRRIDASRDEDEPGFDSSGTRLVEAISSWPGEVYKLPETETPEVPQLTQPDAILRYLADAERTINEVNEAIDRRLAGQPALSLRATPPSSDDQAKAFAELLELTGNDYYSFEQARSVKGRITRLGEVSVRLRSLIELCNAGHLTAQEVGHKRDALVATIPSTPADD